MRSFTFDVVDTMNADGYCRVVEGSKWMKLAQKMVSEGRATLVENRREFAGYGGSRDVSYWRFNMTVTELPGAFSA
jgi:hypothetical protein